MRMNEADTHYHLIDPVLRDKGYVSRDHITLETVLKPAPVEPSGPKGNGGGDEGSHVAEMRGQTVVVNPQGRFILVQRDGRDTPIREIDQLPKKFLAHVFECQGD